MLGILFIGDIVGRPGRQSLPELLSRVKRRYQVDLVIANGENAAGGKGITRDVAEQLFRAGVDIITSGNHIWDKREALDLLSEERRIIRPANYPPGAPGRGSVVVEVGLPPRRVLVVNVCGRTFMPELDCPFRAVDQILQDETRLGDIVVVDVHAEATSEKAALGYYLDGRVTVVLGTHTHVQTADERLLPKGTAFISDVGMVGARDSILGVTIEPVVQKFLSGLPARFEVAKGPVQANAIHILVDANSPQAVQPPTRISELID
ncbi:MAG: TIGR00282 family metallophosphoesterase [Firmicutes bacterium]|jgi:metallophosphoesterase (TIGR00282 family)|nr:TIGR00282 family metallophosphoesterase [Bacillota bacterium]